MKIMSIDPSGSGTTAISLINLRENDEKSEVEFISFENPNWKKHYEFIKEIAEKEISEIIIFEDTNYIHKKTKDGLSLFRLLGAIEFINKKNIISINVLKVKALRRKLLEKKIEMEEVEYMKGRGKGWMFRNKRIDSHCLDAYLIYSIWKKEKIMK